jgi:antitoxin (DNA-binding transcriptional repressor) of toxin-antitoxin stability system
MKVLGLQDTTLASCIQEAQHERVVITRDGTPVALVVGIEGLDLEQIYYGQSDEFWQLIRERRAQKTVSWEEMERQLAESSQEATNEG